MWCLVVPVPLLIRLEIAPSDVRWRVHFSRPVELPPSRLVEIIFPREIRVAYGSPLRGVVIFGNGGQTLLKGWAIGPLGG